MSPSKLWTKASIVALAVLGAPLAIGVTAFPFSYSIRESVPIPTDSRVLAVRDMDADGNLDVVIVSNTALTILERSGNSFVPRFTHSEGGSGARVTLRAPSVAEVDGDSTPEFVAGSFGRFRIWESDGNDHYVVRFTYDVRIVENSTGGDSDGNGRREYLLITESFPSRLLIFEAQADNVYSRIAQLTGAGGNGTIGGTADLDGDGHPETVFSDDDYRSSEGRPYVYEQGKRIFSDPSLKLLSFSLGDTDGNGLGEIIGGPNRLGGKTPAPLKVLESTGVGDGFRVVLDLVTDYELTVVDPEGDGRSEFWRRLRDGTGQRRVFTLASRSGNTLSDVYNSGTLLQGFDGDIRGLLAIGDTNGDGGLELAVTQGGVLHILEPVAARELSEIPILDRTGFVILILLLAAAGLLFLPGARGRGCRAGVDP